MKIFRAIKTNWLSQKFGKNKVPFYKEKGMLGHNGVDFRLDEGEIIYWPCDIEGTVDSNSRDSSGGLGTVVITQDESGDFKHIFWHIQEGGFLCVPGDILQPGDPIAHGNNTGRSTGHHLHYGLKKAKKDEHDNWVTAEWTADYRGGIDPMPFFTNIFIKDWVDTTKKQKELLEKVNMIKKITMLMKIKDLLLTLIGLKKKLRSKK